MKDRELFIRYAIPCAGTLVQRGSTTQEVVDDLINRISESRELPENIENMFKVALAMCTLLAKKENKDEIDADIIRKYFLVEHDEIIEKRYKEMGDFDPEKCRTYPGQVIEMKEKTVILKTPKEEKEYKNILIPNLKTGDLVITHWGFVAEKTDIETAKKILKIKNISEDFFD